MRRRSSWQVSCALRLLAGDAGTVTAELAASLPVFVLLLGLLASVAAGQVMRVNLLLAAADAARAEAIGEALQAQPGTHIEYSPGKPGFVCATASSKLPLLALAGSTLELAEQACVKKLGQ